MGKINKTLEKLLMGVVSFGALVGGVTLIYLSIEAREREKIKERLNNPPIVKQIKGLPINMKLSPSSKQYLGGSRAYLGLTIKNEKGECIPYSLYGLQSGIVKAASLIQSEIDDGDNEPVEIKEIRDYYNQKFSRSETGYFIKANKSTVHIK